MTRTTGTTGKTGKRALGAAALCGAALLGAAAPASAAGSGEPDLGHYCRAHHGSHAKAVFRRETGTWACVEQRGFERRYHRVDFAEACRLTFGASGFRPAGAGATCLGVSADGADPTSRPAGPRGGEIEYRRVIPNLSGYCRRTSGRGARVAYDRATGLYVCASRRGVRRIDMAAACYYTVRSTNFRFDGDRREIRCLVSV